MRSWKGYAVAGFVTHSFNNREATAVGQTGAQPWVRDESGLSPVLEKLTSPLKRLVGNMLRQRFQQKVAVPGPASCMVRG